MGPFSRSLAIFEALAAIMAAPVTARAALAAAIQQYESRGHGRGKYSGRKVNRNKQTDWKTRGVTPGAGSRECQRRRIQIARGMLQVSA